MTSHQARLSHLSYRPDIDGLRAIAVLSVVAFHAFPSWVKGGFIGVDVFFVISGYLISTIIFENLDKGTFSFSEFYSRRIRRIFPALLLVLIACFVFGWFALLADEYKQLGKHIAAGAGFISNFILWNEAGYFDNSAETKPLLHLWSLGIEEHLDNKGVDSRNCLKFITENFSRILDDKGISHVILTSRVPMYITSDGFGDVDKYGDWVLHFRNEDQSQRSNKEVYMLGLEKTIDTLIKAGKTITYLHDVPELGFDIHACLDSRPLRVSKKAHTCSIARGSFDARTNNFKDKINNILSKRPSVHVIDLSTALCDYNSCYGKINGVILYRDDDHLSVRGSIYVINKLSNEL